MGVVVLMIADALKTKESLKHQNAAVTSALWVLAGLVVMTVIGMAHPLPMMHGYVWMGTGYLYAVSGVVALTTVVLLTAGLGLVYWLVTKGNNKK